MRHWIDLVGGNRIVGKRGAGERIDDGNALGAEVAVSHGLRGNFILHGAGFRITEAFIGSVEEGFVLAVVNVRDDYRSSYARAKIVGDEFGLGWFRRN